MADDYKEEADEALHTEFLAWLQGRHDDNAQPSAYVNGPGIPTRRYTDAKDLPDGKLIGEEWDHTTGKVWRPTWWGNNSLLHLPGVREYLRDMKTKSYAADLQMNLLAEHGPQDLSQAWMYFKHWVKRRPQHSNMEEGVERTDHKPGDNSRSDFGWQPSQGDDRGGGGGGDDDDGDGGPGGGGGWNFGNFRAHPDLIGPHGVDNLNKSEVDILFGEPVDDAPIQSIEDVVPVVQGELIRAMNELSATINQLGIGLTSTLSETDQNQFGSGVTSTLSETEKRLLATPISELLSPSDDEGGYFSAEGESAVAMPKKRVSIATAAGTPASRGVSRPSLPGTSMATLMLSPHPDTPPDTTMPTLVLSPRPNTPPPPPLSPNRPNALDRDDQVNPRDQLQVQGGVEFRKKRSSTVAGPSMQRNRSNSLGTNRL